MACPPPFRVKGYNIDSDWCVAGGEGHVRKCVCSHTGEVFVVKSVPSNEKESKILSELCHPNVIQFEEVFTDGEHNHILLQFAEGGDLFDYISSRPAGRLSEDEAKMFFLQLLAAVEYIHSRNIVHLDIKPENIFLTKDGSLVLGDFGLAAKVQNVNCFRTKSTGSLLYTPPEVLLRSATLSSSVDIWALGINLYVMLVGDFPFQGADDLTTARAILKGDIEFPSWVSPAAANLIADLLNVVPSNRPTVEEILCYSWLDSVYEFSDVTDLLPMNILSISPKFRGPVPAISC
mmetsp:Transcript_7906/g.19917  ORF Transcript_7906/g.19917 Transcript_7906/m.19917 type:complete len:291 (-) Transcript_7906:307-1179(-)|eukprot:CAMPEP_0177652662 /NCGR_PEP_ID=MMETSP0447-20121125/13261_1 /TAXON_ID=0 /ORGANISM="Stygamoeba regulata, Strain BSH-02190019" /LENGTH=290 /DNA_ID=CAMNT_0019155945 /DNA_START=142 /DNA_END=1014 /DNA_ORIENTATION=-